MYEGDLQEQIYKNSQIHKFILTVKFKSLSNTFITLPYFITFLSSLFIKCPFFSLCGSNKYFYNIQRSQVSK